MKSPVVAESFPPGPLVDALRQHRAERSALLEALVDSFRTDHRIRVGWLWGSFMRDEQDDLSDLDIWLLVDPSAISNLVHSIRGWCREAGTVVFLEENAHNAPPGGGYCSAMLAGTQGLHHLDIYWQSLEGGTIPEAPLFLDRREESVPATAVVADDTGSQPEWQETRVKIGFVWMMLSIAAKYLARDPTSDMQLMTYPRNAFNETVAMLGIEQSIGEVPWAVGETPLEKLNSLRQVAEKTALVEAELRRRRMDLSPEANKCLQRYFDLIEWILRPSGVCVRTRSGSRLRSSS